MSHLRSVCSVLYRHGRVQLYLGMGFQYFIIKAVPTKDNVPLTKTKQAGLIWKYYCFHFFNPTVLCIHSIEGLSDPKVI